MWHFRSAWNVGALNCLGDENGLIVDEYRNYIVNNARALKGVNDRVELEYRRSEESRRAALLAREEHMTRVYNFFSLPSARGEFCRTVLAIAVEARATPPSDPIAFALANFDRLEVPFDRFFNAYETYQRTSAEWDARYGALYGPSQPGWVAVQRARANGEKVPSVEESNPGDTLATPTPTTSSR